LYTLADISSKYIYTTLAALIFSLELTIVAFRCI
jgi:hypothetical protein